MKSEKIKKNNYTIAVLVSIFAILTLFFFGLYVYFVSGTIFNTVERDNAKDKMANIETKVNQLELKYLEKNEQISAELAKSEGFTRTDDVIFASQRSFVQNVSWLEENEL